ncbi:hypothetical protein [Vibrio parahaemolyticus]|uniref:hypothetical protein n=1 Tax=Vibrio parahaemolyticus TaxID=670 RepID=UPI00235E1818|nr:hypothetical protein [Vibrio parahaemolyticus]
MTKRLFERLTTEMTEREYYDRYGLDIEILQYLWFPVFAITMTGETEPQIGKTIQDMLKLCYDCIDDMEDYELSNFGNNCGIASDNNYKRDSIRGLYNDVFKGVNKKLTLPIIIHPYNRPSFIADITDVFNVGEKQMAICIIDEADIIAFSPKNLAKHFNYTDFDARALFKNFQESVLTNSVMPLKMIKPSPKKTPFFRRMNVLSLIDGLKCYWPHCSKLNSLKNEQDAEFFEKELKALVKEPIPPFPVSTWRNIAKGQYERLNQGSDWNNLTNESQKRRIVNSIRHNSVGYMLSWSPTNDKNEAHDRSFEIIMRKIIQTYPYLADECRKQLDNRGI